MPLAPRLDYDTVKDFSQAIVQHLAKTIPARFVSKSGPANRVGKLFVDYLRNGHGATTAAAFSARARPGLGVSMPVAWEDLSSLKSGAEWTIRNAREYLSFRKRDPWSGLLEVSAIPDGSHEDTVPQTQAQGAPMKIPTLALICLAATAIAADEAPVTSQSFVARASMASRFEVEAGNLAQARAQGAQVKSFGQRMVADHGASNSELEKIVASSYAVPKQLDAEHQAKLDALKGLQGQEFDTAYGKDMMQGHEQAIELFTKAATSAQVSPSLQAFARKTLPTLQEHGKLALGLPGAHTHTH